MDIITKLKVRLERKVNVTLPALLPYKIENSQRGLETLSYNIKNDNLHSRNKRAIPLLAIVQGTTAIDRMLIKGINALVDAKKQVCLLMLLKCLMQMLRSYITDLSL